jgi:hypothetical protein
MSKSNKEASKAMGNWVDVIGSEDKNDGRFTEEEKDAVYELGLYHFGQQWAIAYLLL